MDVSNTPEDVGKRASTRLAFLVCGYAFFGLGLLGAFLPVLPTTVFWIIAAICFARSSPRMYRKIMAWPRVGAAINDFVADGIIARRSKAIALSGMAIAALVVAFTPLSAVPMALSLGAIAVGACYVVSRPSRRTGEITR